MVCGSLYFVPLLIHHSVKSPHKGYYLQIRDKRL